LDEFDRGYGRSIELRILKIFKKHSLIHIYLIDPDFL
jgi:hypothetical protein